MTLSTVSITILPVRDHNSIWILFNCNSGNLPVCLEIRLAQRHLDPQPLPGDEKAPYFTKTSLIKQQRLFKYVITVDINVWPVYRWCPSVHKPLADPGKGNHQISDVSTPKSWWSIFFYTYRKSLWTSITWSPTFTRKTLKTATFWKKGSKIYIQILIILSSFKSDHHLGARQPRNSLTTIWTREALKKAQRLIYRSKVSVAAAFNLISDTFCMNEEYRMKQHSQGLL